MASLIITNIAKLCGLGAPARALRGKALATIEFIDNAYLIVEDQQIAGFGQMTALPQRMPSTVIDAAGGFVLPAWCDSHTHLVYAGSREGEFVDKLQGRSYAEIAAKGGGILNSAKSVAAASEDELFTAASARIQEAISMGTANFEIKSGYGLTLNAELKMLRVIRRLGKTFRSTIRSTFLGAHAIPAEFSDNRQGYIDLIIKDMLPAIEREQLADYIDVFCEKGFFSVEETVAICNAGKKHGLRARIHANQLSDMGAVQAGIEVDAISVDHLEVMNDASIKLLGQSATIATMLPTAAFFLRAPFQPARQLIAGGCAVALASDANPGSSPGYNMNFVVALACIGMKMLPEEAINAATINGAFALGLQQQTGSIHTGKMADLLITRPIPSLAYLPYSFSSVLVDKTLIKGELIYI